MGSVYANSRSIVHKGDGQKNIAAPPDVCKTPSPGGPIPTPFVNIAEDSALASGSKKTKIKGNPIAHKSANLSTSSGDEPGTAGGGIISSKFKGKLTWASSSTDVKVEGKGVVRFMDPTMHNGNNGNVPFLTAGDPSPKYGADFIGPCAVCGKTHDEHPSVESSDARPTAKHVTELIDRLTNDFTMDRDARRRTLEEEIRMHNAQRRGIEERLAKLRARRAYFNAKAPDPEALKEANTAHQWVLKLQEAKALCESKRQAARTEVDALSKAMASQGVTSERKMFYMVGAMMCESHTAKPNETVYIAASGEEHFAGFDRVTRAMPGKFEPIPVSGKVTQQNYEAKNSLLANTNKMECFKKKWDEAAQIASKEDDPQPPPGVCAAQHLLSYQGHQPRALTEAWFDPAGRKPVNVKHIRQAREFYEEFKAEKQVDWTAVKAKTYTHHMHVPSCRTCQALLPFLLCDEKKQC